MRKHYAALFVLAALGGAAVGRLGAEGPHEPSGLPTAEAAADHVDPASGRLRGAGSRAAPQGFQTDETSLDEACLEGLLQPGGIGLDYGFVLEEAAIVPVRDPAERRVRGLLAHAQLHALAGRTAELLRTAAEAVHAGADQELVLDCYLLLDARHADGGGWSAAIDALRARTPHTDWNPQVLASHAVAMGAEAWARSLLATTLEHATEPDASLAAALIGLGPQDAAGLLRARIAKAGWHDDASYLTAVAQALIGEDAPKLAMPFIRWALDAAPFDQTLLKLLAGLDPAAAFAQARRRVGEHPDDVEAWAWIAAHCHEQGDKRREAEALREIFERRPETKTLMKLIEADAELGLELARKTATGSKNDEWIGILAHAYLVTGQRDASYDTFAQAQRMDPEDYGWLLAMIDLDPARTVRTLSAQAASPEAGDETLGAYGQALLESGEPKQAWTAFERAWRKDADDSEWMLGLALSDPARAAPLLALPGPLRVETLDQHAAYAVALYRSGRQAEGATVLDWATKQKPSRWLLRMYAKADPVRALAAAARAIEQEPTEAEWWGAAAAMHAERRSVAEARKHYEQAIALAPTDAEWRRRLELLR